MEAAENPARRDPAVLGEGMSIVTLPRQEGRCRFRNPWSEAQMGAPLVVMSHPLCHDSAQMFLSQRNHEIQTLPPYAFAFGARTGVRSTRSPKAFSCWSTSAEKIVSRSWRRKR